MTTSITRACLVLACASSALAQGYGGGYGGGGNSGNPYSDGGDDSNGGSNNPFSGGNNGFGSQFSDYHTMVMAHGVLAALAFVLLFPIGGIMIRLASFPGLWWVHGAFQAVAFIIYIAAFALGVNMARGMRMLDQPHAIIGIVVFVLLLFQPILGILHHTMFKKHSRRVVWSYGHIWLGRFVITLGIINGGLGLQLATWTRRFAPSQGAIIAYGVIGGIMWLLYAASAVYGEMKRRKSSLKGEINTPPRYQRAPEEEEMRRYA
ncbi:hypothetical protein LTR97_012354 [Elasticomyces elasticus]|uniref:Cytochrome b561 domain-containing protein n=1 Tax=Elasticomyces elasticus TaxID=574655 RepID=A0AAN7ZUZ0_9PEZI|nr:hypothetical protein LTR97_012354 [Elasticomyces elasticus]KAK5722818.1 hypothetical protein LTR15_006051 [Elasticomyces elasticus]